MTANLLIAGTKFCAAWSTGSSAILSEGVHSLVDTGNQVLLLYGLHRAERPPDEQFPFGHGKEIYFWSFVVAILIFALGAGISLYEGILHLLHPSPLENPFIIYIIITAALVFEGVSWVISIREFRRQEKSRMGFLQAIRKGKDPSLFLVVMEDSAAMLGLLVALAGISLTQLTGSPLFDGTASVVIGLILGVTAMLLARETKGLLIGEAADVETVRAIRKILIDGKYVDHVNEVLTLHMGPDFVVTTVSLDFADHVPAGEVERTVVELETAIRNRVPEVKKVFIEAEAWRRPK
ncbi:cation diffusion facilitator family transporter [Geobacter chapellei]|uniref:Cation diffusion facilitator family transporter n=2 Tax=Pelotalea chapellei TaxID=44671 RepID=A0ABS5U3W9_9BACT|nr:cation diffusion facilitator family transporter [Pelotalea chapellei]